MPELPEVEAVCRRLRNEAIGLRIIQVRFERDSVTRPQSRTEVESAVAGETITGVDRRGKNILLRLRSGVLLHVHLRMTGNLYVVPDVRFRPADTRAWFELEDGRGIVFADPRALGKIHLRSEELKHIGMEPLTAEFTSEYLVSKAKSSRTPAKLFLMDQRHVAGLGNIYAAEALFRARINPLRPINRVSPAKLRALHGHIVEILEEAVVSAEAAYSQPGRYTEGESFECAVYDREGEPCFVCGRKIKRIPQGGRSTYYCSNCQR